MVFTIHSVPIDENDLAKEFESRAITLEKLLAAGDTGSTQARLLRDSLHNLFSCLPLDLREQNQKKYDFLVGSSSPRYN